MKVIVTGAGGFIGGYLVKWLLNEGNEVRAIDKKPLQDWWQVHAESEVVCTDLSSQQNVEGVIGQADELYCLAAAMGGIGRITQYHTDAIESQAININAMLAARNSVDRIFFASSACAYDITLQSDADSIALKESNVWTGPAEYGYGTEKLCSEQYYQIGNDATELEGGKWFDSRIARYHNIFGPNGSYAGGKEKAPAAICRKVAEAAKGGTKDITIWGDGTQTRSFCYVDDCVDGTMRVMRSDYDQPLNVGSSRSVTVDELVDIVEAIGGVKLNRIYDTSQPQGVKGRNSDNTLIKETLGWEPSISLEDGLAKTYEWIYDRV